MNLQTQALAWFQANKDTILIFLAGMVCGGLMFGQHHVRRGYGYARRHYRRWRGYRDY